MVLRTASERGAGNSESRVCVCRGKRWQSKERVDNLVDEAVLEFAGPGL